MNLLVMNIPDMQDAMNKGTLSSYDITKFYLDRIVRIDNGDPNYNSVFEVNPDALFLARQRDAERKRGTIRSAIHGIPVLLKDNINTGDKTRTTAGANILKDHFAKEDAYLVKTLREQGAVILGKTNLTELACFKSFNTVNGFSSLAGYVLCPWNTDEDPSGSSTGSAVAVSLRLAPLAIGTETGGSIMSPSMKNGVVGIKPTIGHVSRRGIVPISSTLDTAGPMATNVTDAALLLGAIRANDPLDPVTNIKDPKPIDYAVHLKQDGLTGKRIGIDRSKFDELSDQRKAAFEQVLTIFKDQGATLIEDLDIQQTKQIYHVMKYEFKRTINAYLAEEGLPITLADIVDYNHRDEQANLKYGQAVLLDVLNHTSGQLNEVEYLDALDERDKATAALNDVFEKHQLDMIYFASYTSLGPHCGYPTLSMPIGLDEDGMPIGTYFLARHEREDQLIEIAYALEQQLNLTFDPLTKTHNGK